MKYLYIQDSIVMDIIPEEDPVFPGIPKEDRYTAEFLAQLTQVDDAVEVERLWIYDAETDTYKDPNAEVIPDA